MPKEKLKNINTINIGLYWDQLWRQMQVSNESALWDVLPSEAISKDYSIFQSAFNSILPILDLGCGSGIQTGFLGSLYSTVIGIDASKKAIALAQKQNDNSLLIFVQLNVLDKEAVTSFKKKTGDANIYLRGVLHQIPTEHRPAFIDHIKILMGEAGTLYLIETAPNIQVYIQDLASRFSQLPLPLKRVLTSHFPPLGISLSEIQKWFKVADYKILESGYSTLQTNMVLEKDHKVELPAVYALIKHL
ncbi:MAG: SAM-dependent methyltransferase [Saprospiraceae bacterium]|jgi:SAM-dependent methyltransferase